MARVEGKMSQFGTQLIREGLISPEQLEEAMRMRSLYGGRLGSNLVELGFVHADAMSGVLGRQTGFPVATQAMFDEVTDEALALVPSDMAERLECVPLRKDGRRLHVAMAQPQNLASTDALSFRTGLRIVPYVALELRLKHAQESKYGIANAERSVGLQSRERLIERARATAPAAPASSLPTDRGAPATPKPAPAPRLFPLDAQGVVEALRTAVSREVIAEALLRFGAGVSDTVILFQVRDGMALGWKGQGPELSASDIERVRLPLSAPSFFQTVVGSQQPFQGAMSDKSLHGDFYTLLKREPPTFAALVPIAIRNQVVNLVYVEKTEKIDDTVESLMAIAPHVVAAYARLVRAAKTQQ